MESVSNTLSRIEAPSEAREIEKEDEAMGV